MTDHKQANQTQIGYDPEAELHRLGAEIRALEAPGELETLLTAALQGRKKKKTTFGLPRGLIAAVIAVALLFTYSFDTLAYYGKKATGYQDITDGHIRELSEEGAGQEIKRSITFSNGIVFTLDTIVFDEHELVAFYQIKSENQKLKDIGFRSELQGLGPITYTEKSGQGVMVDDYTQYWVQSYEAPKFFEKWLKLNVTMMAGNRAESGKIGFTLDRSKAMKRMIRQEISASVEIDGHQVTFLSITASRLSTVIEGIIRPALVPDIEKDTTKTDFFFDRPQLKFDLFVDGSYYTSAYAGASLEKDFSSFRSDIMGLPAEFTQIEIRNVRFVSMKLIDRSLALSLDTENLELDEDLAISKVFRENGDTCISIRSKGIPVMGLFFGDRQAEAAENPSAELPEKEKAVERTFRFHGIGDEMELKIKVINYNRYSTSNLPIPLME